MSIAENIAEIKHNIDLAKQKSPDPAAGVTLVAVTKMHDIPELSELGGKRAEYFR